ncbi:MAG: arylsulfatase [Planctomycetota bacterium]
MNSFHIVLRPFSWILFLVGFGGFASANGPNVLLILTDDQGWGDLGVHGNEILATPTLDSLAHQSVRLDRFYVSPVCAPTRAALLTGRYPERTGVVGVTSRWEVMRSEEVTLAEMFSDAGYATGCFGKWHNGAQMPLHPNGQGFDEFFGFCGGHFNLYDDPLLEHNGRPVQTNGYITNVLTDRAIAFLQEHRKEPWFCYVPYNTPHTPCQVNQKLFDKYNDGSITEMTAAVYAMVENIDTNVARLLTAVEDQGRSNDTIVIFLTDNGPNGPRFNGGMRGRKGSVHEGGCRVPCMIRWPERIQARVIDQVTAHIDLLPTLADWCGLERKGDLPLDGKSLARLIENGSDSSLAERCLLTNRPNSKDPAALHRAAARTNRFRLTIERGKTSLFDMEIDPGQNTNIAAARPTVTKRLEAKVLDYLAQTQDSIRRAREIPVGGRVETYIPGVDSKLHGNPGFADGISWSHSWVDNWVAPDDRVSWPLEVIRPGKYELRLHYTCSSAEASVAASVGNREVAAKLPLAAVESVVRPDLDPRAKPRRMLRFETHPLGVMTLSAGKKRLELRRDDSTGAAIELSGVTFRHLPDAAD